MIQGETIEGIQAAIAASLVGNTLTGTKLACVLATAIVDQNTSSTFYEVVNGSVVVTYEGGNPTSSGNVPQTSGGRIQRRWVHQFRARVTYSNRVASGQELATDAASFARQIVNLIEAGLEPQSGAIFVIPTDGISLPKVQTHSKDPGFNVQDVLITVWAFWAR